jgi:hypothetical protein
MEERRTPPMSISQVQNYIAAKKRTMASDMKKIVGENAQISIVNEHQRKQYIMNGLSCLCDITEEEKNIWCALANKAPNMYTTKEVAIIMKKLMVLSINNVSLEQISKTVGVPLKEMESIEALCVFCVMEAIELRKAHGIPLVGGMN